MFTMRFAMRSTTSDPDARASMYGAALEMVGWAESRGCAAAVVSEHHGSDDGYLPSPVPLVAAMAARTTTLPITVAALLLAFYEPVRLAEDMVVVDLLSRGRVGYVVGIGYRDEEFDMFGIDRRTRAQLVEQRIATLRQLWSGEACEVDGRNVRITPPPFTPGGPMLAYGGGTEAAAQRAGRLGMLFLAERRDAALETSYLAAASASGVAPVGCIQPAEGVPATMFVAEDPEKAWAEIGEYLLVDAVGYGRWNKDRSGVASVSFATTVEELQREEGEYRIITPAQASAYVAQGIPLLLQPLAGGIPRDVAWPYLEAAARVSAEASS